MQNCGVDRSFELVGLSEKKSRLGIQVRGRSYSWLGDQCAICSVTENEAAAGGEAAGPDG